MVVVVVGTHVYHSKKQSLTTSAYITYSSGTEEILNPHWRLFAQVVRVIIQPSQRSNRTCKVYTGETVEDKQFWFRGKVYTGETVEDKQFWFRGSWTPIQTA